MSWPMVKLGNVATLNPRAPKELDSDQIVSFVGMASVSEDGYLQSEEPRVLEETKKGFTYFAKSDVLLAKITPCFENGKCLRANQISNPTGFGSTEFHVLRPDESKLDATYLFYMIWSNQFRTLGAASMFGAAGQKRVGSDFLKNFEIPLPPLAEQKRIAAILDKADAIRRKRQQAIQLADDFLRAVFLQMFGDPVTNPKGWEVKPLGQNIAHANNGLSRRRKEQDNVGDIVLRLQDVHYDGIRFDKELNRIKLEQSEKERFHVDKGDILFIRVNGNPDYVGRSAVFDGYKEHIYHNDHLIRLKINEVFDPIFLSYCFNYEGGRKIISGQIKTSAGQHTISQSGIYLLDFYIPPISLQKQFVLIRKSLMNIRFDDATTACLFDSLSQKSFSGKL
ncbi:restriction endonuclease subunit S [Shewanella putrefaciens]|uniref:restriction endonuclease subunit S n=1 Tax=Shewanella putrefaciens TaxID=24 RepID=UPI003D7A102D